MFIKNLKKVKCNNCGIEHNYKGKTPSDWIYMKNQIYVERVDKKDEIETKSWLEHHHFCCEDCSIKWVSSLSLKAIGSAKKLKDKREIEKANGLDGFMLY